MEFSGGRTLMFKCGLSDKMSHSPEGRSSGHTPQTSSFITPVPTVENILQCLWFPCFWQLCFCQSCRTGKKIVSRNKNKSFSCFVLSWIWMSVEIEASPAQFFKIVAQSELTFPFAGVKLENFWFSQKSRHMHATALAFTCGLLIDHGIALHSFDISMLAMSQFWLCISFVSTAHGSKGTDRSKSCNCKNR